MNTQRMAGSLAVRFVRRWNNYFTGDVATFPARMSQQLVAKGVAEAVNIAPREQSIPVGAEFAMRPSREPPRRRAGASDDGM